MIYQKTPRIESPYFWPILTSKKGGNLHFCSAPPLAYSWPIQGRSRPVYALLIGQPVKLAPEQIYGLWPVAITAYLGGINGLLMALDISAGSDSLARTAASPGKMGKGSPNVGQPHPENHTDNLELSAVDRTDEL